MTDGTDTRALITFSTTDASLVCPSLHSILPQDEELGAALPAALLVLFRHPAYSVHLSYLKTTCST